MGTCFCISEAEGIACDVVAAGQGWQGRGACSCRRSRSVKRQRCRCGDEGCCCLNQRCARGRPVCRPAHRHACPSICSIPTSLPGSDAHVDTGRPSLSPMTWVVTPVPIARRGVSGVFPICFRQFCCRTHLSQANRMSMLASVIGHWGSGRYFQYFCCTPFASQPHFVFAMGDVLVGAAQGGMSWRRC